MKRKLVAAANPNVIMEDKENIPPNTMSVETHIKSPKKQKVEKAISLMKNERLLNEVYKKISNASDLLFGVDKDIEDLPAKRERKPPKNETGIESLHRQATHQTPDTVSAGYGEITRGGFQRILHYLQFEAPEHLRISSNSTFLDIGSGFGKTVFHTKLQVGVKAALGVEYVQTRAQKSVEVLREVEREYKEDCSDLSGVEFRQEDATIYRSFPHSHIYCYDYIFNASTHAKLLPIIAASKFSVFVCFSAPAKIGKFGVCNLELLHKMSVHTTGKQNFTVYFYQRKHKQ